MSEPFELGGVEIGPGESEIVNLSVGRLYDFTEMKIPVRIIRGYKSGPVFLTSAAIHGDEINGVEIIRRLFNHKSLKQLKGTLVAVPIVNVYGFNARSRYLPDGRDLNRCFPGSSQGSLASQMAHIFMTEIVEKCTHGIDLHTGARHRSNLPQVRGSLDAPETMRLAKEFEAPVILHSALRDGSLREAAAERDIPMLLFEGGEALRFDERVISRGLRGVLSVMRAIDMLPPVKKTAAETSPFIARSSHWIRAPQGGILRVNKKLGHFVKQGDLVGTISSPLGKHRFELRSQRDGVVVGMTMQPLVNRGDGMFHIATVASDYSPEENHAHMDIDDWVDSPF